MKVRNRVKKAQDFQKLIRTGKKFANPSFVFYYKEKENEQARVGISISKKIGHAVERNLYKRQVRMMCQEVIDFDAFPYDIILIIRFGYKGLNYAENKKNLEKLVQKSKIK